MAAPASQHRAAASPISAGCFGITAPSRSCCMPPLRATLMMTLFPSSILLHPSIFREAGAKRARGLFYRERTRHYAGPRCGGEGNGRDLADYRLAFAVG